MDAGPLTRLGASRVQGPLAYRWGSPHSSPARSRARASYRYNDRLYISMVSIASVLLCCDLGQACFHGAFLRLQIRRINGNARTEWANN